MRDNSAQCDNFPTSANLATARKTILFQATQPDKTVVHNVPDQCHACHLELPFACVRETRQAFDLPVLKFEVTKHQATQAICACGHTHTAEFPAGVNATVQYGPRAQAAMAHLNLNHAVSVQRTAAFIPASSKNSLTFL